LVDHDRRRPGNVGHPTEGTVMAKEDNVAMIELLPFGPTGHQSTRIIFGAAALSDVSQQDADSTLELIGRHAINHIDTAASYGDSELRLAPWLERHRDEVFLASKTGERTRAKAYAQIRRSLERLRTDHLDLIQLHNLVDEDEWQTAFAPGGVLEAVVQARDEGLVRFIGVTGHGITVATQHLRSLEQFPFDSVLLPYNYPMSLNAGYMAEFEALVEVCRQRNVAVQTIKAITRAPWGDREHTASTWYEPLRDQAAIDAAVSWVLGRPGVFLNTVGDITILPKVLVAAERFTGRPDDAAMRELDSTWGLEPLFV
jgi:aryl-alcohol dehydrogenase-like predicted oxidoreductase